MSRLSADGVIALLNLSPLPGEGGFYRQTFESPHYRHGDDLPSGYWSAAKKRALIRPDSTAIYYLITRGSFSALHRLKATEVWHFYLGDPVEMLLLLEDEKSSDNPGPSGTVRLGTDLEANMKPQVVVLPLVWQGARLADGGEWALLGTTMSPGYHEDDFELGQRTELIAKFPAWTAQIINLTRE